MKGQLPEQGRSFRKLLVANRGEIAIRIFRAASELKIRTVAVYTYEDRYSLHRYKADEAYQIGKDTDPLKPYLDIEEIISIAKRQGVDAIHPGYGFLSENYNFAARCTEEGLTFIGPRADVLDRLGNKISAKKLAALADVPMIPDSNLNLTDSSIGLKEAERIGYPVILKAASGGGGRGMRMAKTKEELARIFDEARNEAARAFGDDTVFLEKFIEEPKHIEVQILGDNQGNLVHLFERDCSVQRRFQKVVEIGPSPTLSQKAKDKLYEYAIKIGRSVNYNNAGTVEFLVDKDENIFFIEVNPRIQVEHTVTEEITQIDLVRSQILIASGKSLDSNEIGIKNQESIRCSGFAVQCRITTENPEDNFKPDFGRIIAYRNAGGMGIRLDEGSTYPGVKISPFFDSMLVKVTASGLTLEGACARIDRTLKEFRIRGVKTNIPFLENVIRHPEFTSGKATVKFIESHPELFDFGKRLDRGTRTLNYLADIIVNGNPDVKNPDRSKTFETAPVPDYDRYGPYPDGSKQRLEKLGREGFIKWLLEQKSIQYTDTTFRDAHQSLLATRVRTVDMLRVAESFAKNHPETFSMEVWGGATFDVTMRFLHENPWERLRLLRKAIPNILLQMLVRGSNAVGYTAYPDNLIVRFIEKASEEGIDIFRIFDSLNWVESMKVSIKAVRERTNSLAEACISYTGDILSKGEKKYTLNYYLEMAKQLEDEGAHILGIKDMAGLLKPFAAEVLIGELKSKLKIPVHLHTHDTSSIQSASYLKAIESGVDVIDVAIASMSGLTSQPNFNSIVAFMEGHKRELKYDLDKLNEFSDYWEVVRNYYYPFESGLLAGTAEVFKHEIPGGQYSNLRPQAQSLGLEHKFREIKKNYVVVNELFGNIVKVTPSSKVVGDLALFMASNGYTKDDILEKGNDLAFPQSVVSFFKGDLGQPYGGFPEKLQKMVLKNEKAFTDLPNAHLEPVDLDSELKKLRKKYDPSLTELDLLSWLFYPKVFDEYYQHLKEFGNVSRIPSPAFFYGMKPNEELLVEIDKGKTVIIELLNVNEANEDGIRMVLFRINGQTRGIEVKDRSVKITREVHQKADGPKQIGSPLQGKLSRVFVKPGDQVKRNEPLFVIEAMKMESTISANEDGKIRNVKLKEETLLEQGDLIVEME